MGSIPMRYRLSTRCTYCFGSYPLPVSKLSPIRDTCQKLIDHGARLPSPLGRGARPALAVTNRPSRMLPVRSCRGKTHALCTTTRAANNCSRKSSLARHDADDDLTCDQGVRNQKSSPLRAARSRSRWLGTRSSEMPRQEVRRRWHAAGRPFEPAIGTCVALDRTPLLLPVFPRKVMEHVLPRWRAGRTTI